MMAVFGAFNAIVSHYELVQSSPRAFHELGVVTTVALAFVPSTIESVSAVREADRARTGGRSVSVAGSCAASCRCSNAGWNARCRSPSPWTRAGSASRAARAATRSRDGAGWARCSRSRARSSRSSVGPARAAVALGARRGRVPRRGGDVRLRAHPRPPPVPPPPDGEGRLADGRVRAGRPAARRPPSASPATTRSPGDRARCTGRRSIRWSRWRSSRCSRRWSAPAADRRSAPRRRRDRPPRARSWRSTAIRRSPVETRRVGHVSAISYPGVSFGYPDGPLALDDVDLEVHAGEILLVVGSSGSGKSTLLRAANGLVPHSTGGRFSGDVVAFGRSTRTHKPRELADVVGFVAPGSRGPVRRRPGRGRPRVRAREPRAPGRRDAAPGRGGARRARHRAPARPQPGDALGRRAPTRRDRRRAGRRAARARARRADVAARPAGRRRRARRGRPAQRRPRHHRRARRAPARARRTAGRPRRPHRGRAHHRPHRHRPARCSPTTPVRRASPGSVGCSVGTRRR